MKIRVDLERCSGHARCEAVAGEVFATDEVEGRVVLLTDEVTGALEQVALKGAKACPERAITILGGLHDDQQMWPPSKDPV